jgi:hypothetical protein
MSSNTVALKKGRSFVLPLVWVPKSASVDGPNGLRITLEAGEGPMIWILGRLALALEMLPFGEE